MEKRTNKIKLTSLLLAVLMLLSVGSAAASAEGLTTTNPTLVVAAEAFSIGNGYAAAPEEVTCKEGENLSLIHI